MPTGQEPETERLTLDIPQREGKEGYVGTLFSLYLRFGWIMADPSFRESDIRIYYMTKFLISLIPGAKKRDEIKKQMKIDIEAAMKTCGSSNEDKSRARNEVCLDYVGVVHDFVDKHIGVSSENKIGFDVADHRRVI